MDPETLTAARKACADLAALEAQIEAVRQRRDKAIAEIHAKDGWRPPEIARALDMSLSNIRLILAKTPAAR